MAHTPCQTSRSSWFERIFASTGTAFSADDRLLGEVEQTVPLGSGASRPNNLPVRLSINFFLLTYTDSAVEVDKFKLGPTSNIGFDLPGVIFERPGSLFLFDLANVTRRQLSRGKVEEFQNEGDNIFISVLPITLAVPPDLQMTDIVAPAAVFTGRTFEVTFEVTDIGGPVPATQQKWVNLLYPARDAFLDIKADVFLAEFERKGVLDTNQSFAATVTVQAPNLISDFNLFAVTDPVRTNTVIGKVFEADDELYRSHAGRHIPAPVGKDVSRARMPIRRREPGNALPYKKQQPTT